MSGISSGAATHGPAHLTWRDMLARIGRAVWRALEAHGRSRGRRELLYLADRWQANQPQLAGEMRAASRRCSPLSRGAAEDSVDRLTSP